MFQRERRHGGEGIPLTWNVGTVEFEWDTVTDRGTDISVGCELVKDADVTERMDRVAQRATSCKHTGSLAPPSKLVSCH
ncbi:unnamed protein product [Rangifer tarandus platyrhynchus]|uniref:Uncharacterized protein n=1 Tax=Rangifer tarandus platyrhynchus TaxID=3082113 RepID=A0AC60A6K9_RANTA